jgi:flavodoxin I
MTALTYKMYPASQIDISQGKSIDRIFYRTHHMKKLGLFYGSDSSNTEDASNEMAEQLQQAGHEVEVIEVINRMDPTRLNEFENVIVGCPTWDIGELQSDWERVYKHFGDIRFDGQKVALFGCGDASGYPDTFQDAIGILGKEMRERGATIVGLWPTEDYDFSQSEALEDDHFLGLALDYDNEADKSSERIAAWVEQIIREFEL